MNQYWFNVETGFTNFVCYLDYSEHPFTLRVTLRFCDFYTMF